MDILHFLNRPIEVQGVLRGFHAILAPDGNRLVALILTRGFKTVTLFVRQKSADSIELELSDDSIVPYETKSA